jgi:hypothetical protein
MASKLMLLSLLARTALSTVQAQRQPIQRRALDDPSKDYLQEMCLPHYTSFIDNPGLGFLDLIPSLHDSPLPCEQENYIIYTCIANDTTEIDFLAEQQCICGSNFLEAYEGCNACYRTHGHAPDQADAASGESRISSIWTAECSARPTQAFTEYLFIGQDVESIHSSLVNSPTITLKDDKFPNNTAVSNYWTGLPSATLGSITGSATARATSYMGGFSEEETSTSSSSRRANFSFDSTATASNTIISTTKYLSSDTSSKPTTSAPVTSTPASAVSQAPSTTSSTLANGGGMEMGLAWNSGVVLVVVNVAVVALL